MGTPSYMSPEQVMGKNVDARADIFSLGVILFELLTNRRPFEGEHITTVVYKIAHEEPPTLSQVRNAGIQMFEPIIKKVLAKDPKDRFQTGKELSTALQRASMPVSADETLIYDASHDERKTQRKTWLPFAAGGLVLALAAAGIFVFKPDLILSIFSPQTDLVSVPPAHIQSADVLAGVMDEAEEHEFVMPKAKPRRTASSSDTPVDRQTRQQIAEGRASLEAGDYAKSRDLMNAVLQKSPGNREARQILSQANAALTSLQEIRALVEQQRAAEQSEDIALLRAFDSSVLEKRQAEVRSLFNDFDNLQCLIPPERIKIQLQDNSATVVFFKIVQGVSRAEGIRKEAFNGEVTWKLIKRGQNWVIQDYTARKIN
jgi:hypothetical protein